MKVYYNQDKISSGFSNFFKNIFSISKPHLKIITFILTGMIAAESVVASDIARKLKEDFSLVNLDSIQRRFRRFFASFSSIAYSLYDAIIKVVISKFSVKHSDDKVYICLDHMFCKDKFTILLFSLRIGKQGIPLWFRCFKGKHNSSAYKTSLINEGISYCANLFSNKKYHIIFLADRWFTNVEIFSHIEDIGCFYCFRSKSFFRFSRYNSRGELISSHLRDIKPSKKTKYFTNALYTRRLFKTNIVVARTVNTKEPWYLITNDDPARAIRNYSYRFSIECIFKSQKSNGFRLESTNTQKESHFISLFTIMCIALLWLTVLGVDFVKNKRHYHINIRDTKKRKDGSTIRFLSFFSLGLTIFNICYYNSVNFILKFNFVLYDV